jgi:hypothetical protein
VAAPDHERSQPLHPFARYVEQPADATVERRLKIMALLSVFGPRCPECGGILVRSRTRGLEQLRKWLSARRPHRCRRCGWRGWRRPVPDDPEAIKHAEDLLAELQAGVNDQLQAGINDQRSNDSRRADSVSLIT